MGYHTPHSAFQLIANVVLGLERLCKPSKDIVVEETFHILLAYPHANPEVAQLQPYLGPLSPTHQDLDHIIIQFQYHCITMDHYFISTIVEIRLCRGVALRSLGMKGRLFAKRCRQEAAYCMYCTYTVIEHTTSH